MPKFTDLTDRKIGSWLVVSRAGNNKYGTARWNCVCECGTTQIIHSFSLLDGSTTNCGCKNELNIAGQRFNRVTVIARHPENTKHNKSQWLCRCDCGREFVTVGAALKSGNTTSCGCAALERRAENGRKNLLPDGGLHHLYGCYRGSANKRGIEFSLTMEQVGNLTSQDCHYCGHKPNNRTYSRRGGISYVYNGIDRIDSEVGYRLANCLPCCGPCNRAKMTMTYDEFILWLDEVSEYRHKIKSKQVGECA